MRHDDEVAAAPRVTVPIDVDRDLTTTVPLAAAIARQGHSDVEFVAVRRAPTARPLEAGLRACCEWALGAGAPGATWSILDGSVDAVGPYATWSGSALLCISTGRHHHGFGRAAQALVRHAAIPILVGGPHGVVSPHGYRRLVVGLDGARPHAGVVAAAIGFALRLDVELVFTQVLRPMQPGLDGGSYGALLRGDVQESAYLHRVAAGAGCPRTSFDTLHAGQPAAGIVRFVGRDEMTITMLGAPAEGHRRCGRVVGSVVRRSAGPVLLFPTRHTDEAGPARVTPRGAALADR
jgi:nucleotide-binding universal stress UspA family protein